MRYERLKDIVSLAIRLQGTRGGMTLDDIQQELSVSRRTTERMRDAVEWAFGPLDCYSAPNFAPPDSNDVNKLVRRSASKMHAE